MYRLATICVAVLLAALTPRTSIAKPVSPEEAAAIAHKIDDAANKGDLSAFATSIDDDEIFNRAVQGLEIEPEIRARLSKRTKISTGLADRITQQIKGGRGSYKLLRVSVRDGEFRPLFRLISGVGVNYHELHLFRNSTGQLRVGDIFIFVAGETLSENLRTAYLRFLTQNGVLKLGQDERELIGSSQKLTEIRKVFAEGRYQDALVLHEKLPDSVKEMKGPALTGVMIRSHLNEKRYLTAIDEYRKRFPDAVGLDLMLIDALFLRGDYDNVLTAIDRLDKRLGGDPYLDLFRGNLRVVKDDPEKARSLFRNAIRSAPDVQEVYRPLIQLELDAERYDDAAAVMIAAERDAGQKWETSRTTPILRNMLSLKRTFAGNPGRRLPPQRLQRTNATYAR